MARDVGDETVILDLTSGTYFGLDPVGARMWQLFCEKRTLSDVCDVMVAEYEVTRHDLERDVLRLASELVTKGLVGIAAD